MPQESTGIGDSGTVVVNDGEAASFDDSGLVVVCVPDPNDPPTLDEHGELRRDEDGVAVNAGGVLYVAAPAGSTVEEAAALLGEPGEVKGPSATVWGDEHAARFGASDAELAVLDTPQGDGDPVKGPGPDFDAAEVIDPPSE